MSENAETRPVLGSAGEALEPGFAEELAIIWKRLPHKLLFFILFAAWVTLFHFYGNATMGYVQTSSMFQWARSVYNGPDDDQHGNFIPFLVLALLWVRRDRLEASGKIWWPAVIYLGLAIAIHFVGFRVQQGRVAVLAFILGLHAMIGLVWGRDAMRKSIFPIFVLLYCIPLGAISGIITVELRMFVTQVSVGLGQFFGIPVFREGSQILDAARKPMYDVAPACSGMRSLIALSALTVIYAFLNFDKNWRRLTLIVSSMPLAVFANIVRITVVIFVGHFFGQEAGAMIEQKFGFLTFGIAIGGMLLLANFLDERPPPKPAEPLREPFQEEPAS